MNVLLKTFTFFFGLIISLAIGEFVFYLYGYPNNYEFPELLPGLTTPDKELGWLPKAGQNRYLDPYSNTDFNVTILSDSSRDTGHNSADIIPKVIWTGCSFTFGYGLDDTDTFQWQIQHRIPEIDIINLGVPGYGTLQSTMRVKKYLKENSDSKKVKYVIYGFADFHSFRNIKNLKGQRYWKEKGIFPYCDLEGCHIWEGKPMGSFLQRSRIYSLYENNMDEFKARKHSSEAEAVTLKILSEFNEFLKQENIKLLVAPLSLENSYWLTKLTNAGFNILNCDSDKLHDKKYRLADNHPNAEWGQLYSDCFSQKWSHFEIK